MFPQINTQIYFVITLQLYIYSSITQDFTLQSYVIKSHDIIYISDMMSFISHFKWLIINFIDTVIELSAKREKQIYIVVNEKFDKLIRETLLLIIYACMLFKRRFWDTCKQKIFNQNFKNIII